MPNIMYHKMKNTSSKQPLTNIPIPTNKANSFGQLVKEGIAFGTGTSIARNVTDNIFHSISHSTEPAIQTPSSTVISKSNTDNDNYCDFLKDQLIHCMSNNNGKCEYLKQLHYNLCPTNI